MARISKLGQVFILSCFLLTLAIVGCGDSGDDRVSNVGLINNNNNNTGQLQVQFDRTDVLAQNNPQAGFAAADQYAVSILDANNNLVVPSTFAFIDNTQNLQTIIVTGVPAGNYTVVLTSFLNGQPTSQVFVGGVTVSRGGLATIGTGTPLTFEIYNGDFVPNPPGGGDDGGDDGGYNGGDDGGYNGGDGGGDDGGYNGGDDGGGY